MPEISFGDPVVFNGGEGKSHRLAFVTDVGDGNIVNLLVFDGDGAGTIEPDVPRRAPADYASAVPPGGGRTWFYRD